MYIQAKSISNLPILLGHLVRVIHVIRHQALKVGEAQKITIKNSVYIFILIYDIDNESSKIESCFFTQDRTMKTKE